tara:strand:+ start:2641 stop:3042 length:402 start_codon:yes stop_codon:yes gene_type:complete
LKALDWLRDHQERLLREWEKRPKQLLEKEIPTTRKEALQRFKCNKLGGGACELEGKYCGLRHLLAKARTERRTHIRETFIFFQERDDKTCSTCEAGKARADLLELSVESWGARYIEQQQRRKKGGDLPPEVQK